MRLAINRLKDAADRTPPPSTGSWPATRCRSWRATGARSCGAATPTPCTSSTGSSGCPTGCRCAGSAAPTCGTSSLELPAGSRVNYQLEVRRGEHVERMNDPLNPKLSHSPVGTLVGLLRERLHHARLDRARPGRPPGHPRRHRGAQPGAAPRLPGHRSTCPPASAAPSPTRCWSCTTAATSCSTRRPRPCSTTSSTASTSPSSSWRSSSRATGSSSTPISPAHAPVPHRELLPHLESELPLVGQRSGRCLLGSSFGAVASLSAAYRAPDLYGALRADVGLVRLHRHRRSRPRRRPGVRPGGEVRQPLPGPAPAGRRPPVRQLRGVRAADHAQPVDGADLRGGGHDGAVPSSRATATPGRTGATACATRSPGSSRARRR